MRTSTHIYDYNDLCPECGKDVVEEINPSDIKLFINEIGKEKERLEIMLKSHDDWRV